MLSKKFDLEVSTHNILTQQKFDYLNNVNTISIRKFIYYLPHRLSLQLSFQLSNVHTFHKLSLD